jgi:hypothetical protein
LRKEPNVIGSFYDHGQWVALHLQSHPDTGDTLVVARLGECPGDVDGREVPLARRPTAGGSLDRALRRLADGWRHASDEPPAPPASARAAIARPSALRPDAVFDRAGTPAQARAVVAYAATADRRGFCFFGNRAAR